MSKEKTKLVSAGGANSDLNPCCSLETARFCNLDSLLLLSLQVVKTEKGLFSHHLDFSEVPESHTKEVGVVISICTVCITT